MTPDEVRKLARRVRECGLTRLIDPQDTALAALVADLLRHLGAPVAPERITQARLAEIEAACRIPRAPAFAVDQWNQAWVDAEPGETDEWWRHTVILTSGGQMCQDQHGPYPTLRAALEAPVVRREGCPPVQEFEVTP